MDLLALTARKRSVLRSILNRVTFLGQSQADADIEAPPAEGPVDQSDEQPSSGADLDRIAELESRLATQLSERDAEIERAKAQAFAEGQAQGQQEAKQMLEMEGGRPATSAQLNYEICSVN